MKISIDVRKDSKKVKYEPHDLMLYDGKEWYITTYEQLYNDLEEKINNAIQKFAEKYSQLAQVVINQNQEINNFKEEVSTQLLDLTELIKKLYIMEGKN